MTYNVLSALLLSGTLLLGACNGADRTTDVGAAGMNAAANEAAANPVVDNPNVLGETEAPNPNAPVMAFTETEYDFGNIKPGDVVKHTFEFTNTGKSPLIIENATASCGCTTPDWTKEPVAPGAKGKMEVQFDSHGKTGMQNKQVSVRANTQPSITPISIKANVVGEAASVGQ